MCQTKVSKDNRRKLLWLVCPAHSSVSDKGILALKTTSNFNIYFFWILLFTIRASIKVNIDVVIKCIKFGKCLFCLITRLELYR